VKNIRLILNVGIALDPKNNFSIPTLHLAIKPTMLQQEKTPKVMCSMLQSAPLLLGQFLPHAAAEWVGNFGCLAGWSF